MEVYQNLLYLKYACLYKKVPPKNEQLAKANCSIPKEKGSRLQTLLRKQLMNSMYKVMVIIQMNKGQLAQANCPTLKERKELMGI